MTTEELLLTTWRELPPKQQQQVLDFAASLQPEITPDQQSSAGSTPASTYTPQTPLGRQLWKIRQQAIAAGEPLLTMAEIEQEIADRRGGYREP